MMRKAFYHWIVFWLGGLLILAAPALVTGNTVYIPHITSGFDDWKDFLQVDNNSTSDARFSVFLYNSDGDSVYVKSYTIPPLSEKEPINLKTIAPDAVCGKITFDDDRLSFRSSYEYINGGLAEYVLSGVLAEELSFNFSSFTDRVASKGIALTNFGDTRAEIVFYAFGGGSIRATLVTTVEPRERLLSDYTALFPEVDGSRLKRIVAVSKGSLLCGVVMQGNTDISNLLFTPAIPVESFALGDQVPVSQAGDYAGTWESGKFRLSGTLSLYYTKDNTTLTGTLSVTGMDCGTIESIPVTGTITNSTMTFEGAFTCLGHPAVLEYTQGEITGTRVTGSYSLVMDDIDLDSGTFVMDAVQ